MREAAGAASPATSALYLALFALSTVLLAGIGALIGIWPALLVWLDADANRKEHPNENLAREILELHTLGVGGGYTQDDVIELANGGDGYIPPPEQHLLGGYNTWPARSAGLEVGAEPRGGPLRLPAYRGLPSFLNA